jgi:hypothetical protein
MKHLKFFHLFESSNGDILPISFTWGNFDPCTFSGIYYPETSEFIALDIISNKNDCSISAVNFFENIRGKRNTIKIVPPDPEDPNDEETEISFMEDNSVITAKDFYLGNPYDFSHHMMRLIKNEHPEIWSEIIRKIPNDAAHISADLGELGF